MNNRRGHGEGTIFERKDSDGNVVGYGAALRHGSGNRKYVYGKTKRDVRVKLDALRGAQKQGLLAASADQKVVDYLDRWLMLLFYPRDFSLV